MLNSSRQTVIFALIWTAVLLVMGAAGASAIYKGNKITGSILDLIPQAKNSKAVARAYDVFSRNMGSKVIIAVSASDGSKAKAAADFIGSSMQTDTSLFSDVKFKFDKRDSLDFYSLFFNNRWTFLSPQNSEIVKRGGFDALCEKSVQRLYQPVLEVSSGMIKKDPFFLFADRAAAMPSLNENFSVLDGHLIFEKDETVTVLISASIAGNAFGSSQQKVVDSINSIAANAEKKFTGTDVKWTGMVKYAASAQRSAKSEVSTVGAGSLAGILLLFILSFRSLKELLLALVPVFTGLVFAWAVSSFVFDRVHLITLVFGSSMLGVSIDYSLHYFSHARFSRAADSRQIIKSVFPAITLGMLTSMAGFLSLSIAPFPGLNQMAVFGAAGLAGAWGTVVFIFPLLRLKSKTARVPFLLQAAGLYSSKAGKKLFAAAIILIFAASAGIVFLKADDDIRLLRPENPALELEEHQIQELAGAVDRSRFFLIDAVSDEQLSEREELVVSYLSDFKNRGYLKNFLAASMVVPSKKTRQSRINFMKQLLKTECTQKYFNMLGLSDEDKNRISKELHDTSATFSSMAQKSFMAPYKMLRLGKIDNRFASVVMLDTISDASKMEELDKKFSWLSYQDKVKDISDLFGSYRTVATISLAAAYFLILVLLVFRYSFMHAVRILVPPFTAAGVVLGFMGFTGIHANIFTFLSLMLVLAAGIDYTLFFAESRTDIGPVAFAILLSALTTLLSFGLLALSTTPAISHIGSVMLAGIIIVLIFSPVAKKSL